MDGDYLGEVMTMLAKGPKEARFQEPHLEFHLRGDIVEHHLLEDICSFRPGVPFLCEYHCSTSEMVFLLDLM